MAEVEYGRVVQDALLMTEDSRQLQGDRHTLVSAYPRHSIPSTWLADYCGSVASHANAVCRNASELLTGSPDMINSSLAVHGIAAVLRHETGRRVSAAERMFGLMTRAKHDDRGRHRNGPLLILSQGLPELPRDAEAYSLAVVPDLYNDVNAAVHGDPAQNLPVPHGNPTILVAVELSACRQVVAEHAAFQQALGYYQR